MDMVNALRAAGLVSAPVSVTTEGNARAFLPKTLEELVSRRDFKFLDKVGGVIEFVGENPAEIDRAIALTRKHLSGGAAGIALAAGLEEVKAGNLSLEDLKKKWPKACG